MSLEEEIKLVKEEYFRIVEAREVLNVRREKLWKKRGRLLKQLQDKKNKNNARTEDTEGSTD